MPATTSPEYAIEGPRPLGLVDARYAHLYEVVSPELEELDLFDALVANSDGGWVLYRGAAVRLDHRIENGDEVRSIVVPTKLAEDGQHVATSNLVTRDDKYYLEIHSAVIDEGGNVAWEPKVGSTDVSPARHDAYVIHYTIAYEATPLIQPSLPQVA